MNLFTENGRLTLSVCIKLVTSSASEKRKQVRNYEVIKPHVTAEIHWDYKWMSVGKLCVPESFWSILIQIAITEIV